ncbi:MAG: hypothetical protein ACMXYK_05870 [Candidatus Woesearchaeota archaeon]
MNYTILDRVVGEGLHKTDAKNRLTIPAPMFTAFQNRYVVLDVHVQNIAKKHAEHGLYMLEDYGLIAAAGNRKIPLSFSVFEDGKHLRLYLSLEEMCLRHLSDKAHPFLDKHTPPLSLHVPDAQHRITALPRLEAKTSYRLQGGEDHLKVFC